MISIPPEYLKYIVYLPLFIESFIISIFLTPIVRVIAEKLQVYDNPPSERTDPTAPRRIHLIKKLKLGGTAVIFPFITLTILNVPITKQLLVFILGILILLINGIIDDFYDVSAKFQIMMQIIATLCVTLAGIDISYVSKPLGGISSLSFIPFYIAGEKIYLISFIITVIWILFIINAVKWMAGTDGLAEGNVSIAAIIIALVSIRFQTYDTAVMGFIFAGLMLGFLFFNFYPSKIFSGSSGKSVYGFIIAVLAIYSGAKLGSTIMVLSIPIIDAVWVIFTRIREERPRGVLSLMKINDKRHLHHRLLQLGYSQKKIALIEYTFTGIIGIIALIATGFHKLIFLAIFALIIFILIFTISMRTKKYTN